MFWRPLESAGHLCSQLPLPLVGAFGGRAAAGALAEDGTLGEIADVAALIKSILAGLQSGLQLLPQQQVMPGLLHLENTSSYVIYSTFKSRKSKLLPASQLLFSTTFSAAKRLTSCSKLSFSSSHWWSRMRLSLRGLHPARFSSPRTYATEVSSTRLRRRCMPAKRGMNAWPL